MRTAAAELAARLRSLFSGILDEPVGSTYQGKHRYSGGIQCIRQKRNTPAAG